MKKIVFIGPLPPYRGGISHYNRALLSEMERLQSDYRAFSFKRMYPRFLYPGKSDREPTAQPMALSHNYPWLDSLNPLTWIKTVREINKYNPDLVVFHWWTVFWAVLYSFICLFLCLSKEKPRILFICHNVYDHEAGFFKNMMTRFTLRLADIFLTHSREHQDILHSLFPGKKVLYHPMPVFDIFPRLDLENVRSCLKIPDNAQVGLFFGFIRPYKGLEVLLRAVPDIIEKVPEFHLLVAGEAMYKLSEKYTHLVEKLGIVKHVTFRFEYIPMEETPIYFSAADVLILPYCKASGSALMTLGYHYDVPVIATRTGNLEELIEHGKTGYLAKPQNITSLAQIVVKYFTSNQKAFFISNIRQRTKQYNWNTLLALITKEIGKSP